MDYTTYLREDPWERIKDSLPGKAGDVGRTGDNRRFIEAVTGSGVDCQCEIRQRGRGRTIMGVEGGVVRLLPLNF